MGPRRPCPRDQCGHYCKPPLTHPRCHQDAWSIALRGRRLTPWCAWAALKGRPAGAWSPGRPSSAHQLPETPSIMSAQSTTHRRRRYPDRRTNRGWRERSVVNGTLPCTVDGCGYRREALGRYCGKHRKQLERTGHPAVARSIPIAEWKPLVELAASFVAEQLSVQPPHPSIAAAVRYCDEELALARGRYNAPRSRDRGPDTVDYAARLRRVSGRGLDGRELLARLIAAYLADDRGTEARPQIRSDTHFAHQAARLLLHRALIGRLPWTRVRPPGPPAPRLNNHHDPLVGVRRHAFTRINGAIGVVAIACADELRRRLSTSTTITTKDQLS